MKRKMIAGILSIALLLSALFSLTGCGGTAEAADLMAEITADTANGGDGLTGGGAAAMADFYVRLFQSSAEPGENTLISPLSVLCALAMTANGAKGETLAQMEDMFGLSVPELNECLRAYLEGLPAGDKYKLSAANSIWLKDGELAAEQGFLQANADYYGASVYKATFDDATLKDINGWVAEKTDGMIKEILGKIPDGAVMYLINALAFDAEWEDIYTEAQVRDGTFTADSGETRDVKMMYGDEHRYLDDGSATGFIKYYADRKYAFAALLTGEGVSVADYVASLTGEKLMDTLAGAQETEVKTALPRFESDYSAEMSEILKSMGMTDAFDDGGADFTGIGRSGDGGLFISGVIHKTHIAVDERGTKAGAATAVEMTLTSMPLTEPKTVYLDRPFVYILLDCETNLPVFIGVLADTGE